MQIEKRTEIEIANGTAISQFLAGAAGATLTTLPAFLILPLWAFFVNSYKIVDNNGEEDDLGCAAICFLLGVVVWVICISIGNL